MILIVAAHDTLVDMKALTKHYKTGSGNLRAGDADDMFKFLGATKGGVTLFSIVNDPDNKVHLAVDKRLVEEFDYVGFHPMQNDATTAISKSDI